MTEATVKLHPVLERPHEFDVADFRYVVDRENPSSSFIDMKLVRGEGEVFLRFWEPRNLSIEQGFPQATRGMVFYDRSGDWLDGIGVEVADFEATGGAVLFSARSVELVPNPSIERTSNGLRPPAAAHVKR